MYSASISGGRMRPGRFCQIESGQTLSQARAVRPRDSPSAATPAAFDDSKPGKIAARGHQPKHRQYVGKPKHKQHVGMSRRLQGWNWTRPWHHDGGAGGIAGAGEIKCKCVSVKSFAVGAQFWGARCASGRRGLDDRATLSRRKLAS